MTSSDFDVVVIGAGSAGYSCALRSAQLGLSVALVERDKLGGTCLHAGCIPTKTLLHAAEVADATRTASNFGIDVQLNGIDAGALLEYKNKVVGKLFAGLSGLIESRGIVVVQGDGRLTSPDTVEVEGRSLTGKNIVIATGAAPRTIDQLPLHGDVVITSDQALKLDHIPASVVVVGGGVIGCEFASAWRSLGADVTVVEALPQLLPNEEPEISKFVQRSFRRRGISVRTGAGVSASNRTENGIRIELANGEIVEAETALVAIGRAPLIDGLGLQENGIRVDRGFVKVDGRLRTGVELPGGAIYAVGDIVPGLQLAHRGFAQGIFVAESMAGSAPRPIVEANIPRVTYCDPEVASVGLSESQAAAQHGEIETTMYDLGGNGKSQILGSGGFVKLVRQKDGPVVGIHIVGPRASELVNEAQVIVATKLRPDAIADLVHAHPTQGEALGEAHLALVGKPLHAHA